MIFMENSIKNSKTMGWKGHIVTILIWVIISIVIPFFVIVKNYPEPTFFSFIAFPFVLISLPLLSIILYWLLRFVFRRKSIKQLVERYLS